MKNTIQKKDVLSRLAAKSQSLTEDTKLESDLQTMKLVNNYFAQYDLNRDGYLSLDEFRNVFLSEKDIIQKFLLNCNLITTDDQQIFQGIQNDEFDEDLFNEMNLKNNATN